MDRGTRMELSEEEIAIETLKEVASDDFDTLGDDISPKMAQNILNVLDKQRKEIYRLQNIKRKDIEDLINNEKENIYINYISKDKIREIIAEYKKQLQSADTERTAIMLSNFIIVLNDLLDEN